MQNLCGIPSLAFTTAANHYFLYSTDCIHLSPSIPTFRCLRYPSAKPLQPLIIFSRTPQQTSPRRALFDLPGCTIRYPATCISRDPPVTVRVDLDVRGRLITLRPASNSRVMNANVYKNRWRSSYPANGQWAQLPRPTNTAVACRTARDARSVAKAYAIVSSPSGADDCAHSFDLI